MNRALAKDGEAYFFHIKEYLQFWMNKFCSEMFFVNLMSNVFAMGERIGIAFESSSGLCELKCDSNC